MFSEIVDSVINRSGRGDRKLDIIDYANSTIRECQAKALFFKDLIEDTIPLTNLDPLIWTYPKPAAGIRGFRQMRTVLYPDLSYPPLKQPGRIQHRGDNTGLTGPTLGDKYYYAASEYFVFNNCGTNTTIDSGFDNNYIGVAYYSWLPRLKYYALGHRPASWSDELGLWTYVNMVADTDPTTVNIRKDWTLAINQPPNEPNAQDYVTNWLLFDWNEMIKEGTLAKLFKSIGDNSRAGTSYSLYVQQREDMLKTEAQESVEK